MPDQRQEHIAEVLTAVAGLARRIAVARHAPFHTHRLGRTQVEAIFVLAHSPGPVTASMLVSTLGITAGAVSQLLESLRAQGLVDTAVNPDDGRSRVLRLTEATRAEIESFERQVVVDMTSTFEPLTTDQLGQLATLLRRMPI